MRVDLVVKHLLGARNDQGLKPVAYLVFPLSFVSIIVKIKLVIAHELQNQASTLRNMSIFAHP